MQKQLLVRMIMDEDGIHAAMQTIENLTMFFFSIHSASHQRCAPDERRSSEETTKHLASSETITLSELLTSENDCPLSSVLSLPLSKGATNTTTLSSTTAASPLPGQKFIPQQYAYPQVRFQEECHTTIVKYVTNYGVPFFRQFFGRILP